MNAWDVQKLLGVEDYDVILHGYTLERRTLDIWFQNGKVVLRTYTGDGADNDPTGNVRLFVDFSLDVLLEGLKRAYENRTNVKLVELSKAFGRQIHLTK